MIQDKFDPPWAYALVFLIFAIVYDLFFFWIYIGLRFQVTGEVEVFSRCGSLMDFITGAVFLSAPLIPIVFVYIKEAKSFIPVLFVLALIILICITIVFAKEPSENLLSDSSILIYIFHLVLWLSAIFYIFIAYIYVPKKEAFKKFFMSIFRWK